MSQRLGTRSSDEKCFSEFRDQHPLRLGLSNINVAAAEVRWRHGVDMVFSKCRLVNRRISQTEARQSTYRKGKWPNADTD